MNFMGSTAKTVAMMSSVLCLRPVTVMRPSREPQTNTRPPWMEKKATLMSEKSVSGREVWCGGCIGCAEEPEVEEVWEYGKGGDSWETEDLETVWRKP